MGKERSKVQKVAHKYFWRIFSVHTKNIEFISAIIFGVGGLTIINEGMTDVEICQFFIGTTQKCYPTFLALSPFPGLPVISAGFFLGIFALFMISSARMEKGHYIRGWLAVVMGTLWVLASISLYQQFPAVLIFPHLFLLIGLFLLWAFPQQYLRRPLNDGKS